MSLSQKSFPSYEEYIALAEQKQWKIKDPIEKLDDVIRRYPEIFDFSNENLAIFVSDSASDSNDADSLITERSSSVKYNQEKKLVELNHQISDRINLYQQEMDFLLEILSRSTHRSVDLTSSFYLAIDMIHQVYYRLMKYRLQTRQTRVTTKAETDSFLRQWIHYPIVEMLKVKMNKQFHHIVLGIYLPCLLLFLFLCFFDILFVFHVILRNVFLSSDPNRLTHGDHMNALEKAVQYRVYSLFQTLVQLGSNNLSGAIHVAVRN
jgi:hypothetical protein